MISWKSLAGHMPTLLMSKGMKMALVEILAKSLQKALVAEKQHPGHRCSQIPRPSQVSAFPTLPSLPPFASSSSGSHSSLSQTSRSEQNLQAMRQPVDRQVSRASDGYKD